MPRDTDVPVTTKRSVVLGMLRQEIELGVFPSGGALPVDRVLAERFAVSRSLMSSVVLELVRDGWLRRSRTTGTRVSPRPAPAAARQSGRRRGRGA